MTSRSERGQPFDYAQITERWETLANREQRSMALLRYQLAAQLAPHGICVDVACGTGYGLPMIETGASQVIGADITLSNLIECRRHLPSAALVLADATTLPFREGRFDGVTCLEALYYMPDVRRFLREANSVLRIGGALLITAPNPHRPGFHPSPGSFRYLDSSELYEEMAAAGFEVEMFGAFSWSNGGDRLREFLRRTAVRLHLIPRTIAGRGALKRLLYRDVRRISVFDQTAEVAELHAIDPGLPGAFKMLVGIGRKR